MLKLHLMFKQDYFQMDIIYKSYFLLKIDITITGNNCNINYNLFVYLFIFKLYIFSHKLQIVWINLFQSEILCKSFKLEKEEK